MPLTKYMEKGQSFIWKSLVLDNIKGALKWMVSQRYHIKPPVGAVRKH